MKRKRRGNLSQHGGPRSRKTGAGDCLQILCTGTNFRTRTVPCCSWKIMLHISRLELSRHTSAAGCWFWFLIKVDNNSSWSEAGYGHAPLAGSHASYAWDVKSETKEPQVTSQLVPIHPVVYALHPLRWWWWRHKDTHWHLCPKPIRTEAFVCFTT